MLGKPCIVSILISEVGTTLKRSMQVDDTRT